MGLPSKISGHGAAPPPRCLSAQRVAAEYLAVQRLNVGVVCPRAKPLGRMRVRCLSREIESAYAVCDFRHHSHRSPLDGGAE